MWDILVDILVLIIFLVPLYYCWDRLFAFMNNHRLATMFYIVISMTFIGIHLVQSTTSVYKHPTTTTTTTRTASNLDITTITPKALARINYEYWLVIEPMNETIVHRNVGDRVELECEARGSPPPVIQWFKGEKQITSNLNFPETVGPYAIAKVKSRLVFNHILPRHHGVYRCVAQGTVDKYVDVTLNIVDKEKNDMNITEMIEAGVWTTNFEPRVTFWSTFYMDDMGKDIVLPCMSSGKPTPSIGWIKHDTSKNHEDLYPSGRYNILPEGALQIKGLKWDDLAVYSCILKNEVGTDIANTFVYPFLHDSSSQLDEFLNPENEIVGH